MGNGSKRAEFPSIAVIVLMWNRWEDTIECLESVFQQNYPNYQVILVDNGSAEESLKKIREYCNGLVKINSSFVDFDDSNKPIQVVEVGREELQIVDISSEYCSCNENGRKSLINILNRDNLGFAKGNNVGIKFALSCGFDYVMLLNNDTVIAQKDFLWKMVNFMQKERRFGACVPCICYYDMPDSIWNCGGKLLPLGQRRYFKGTGLLNAKSDFIEVSFVTGCCLLIRSDNLKRFGLLSEDFFFGEEDYEFSIRMNKNNVKMACLLKARIYHKVSSTGKELADDKLKMVFVHHLNRIVHMKRYYSQRIWRLYKIVALAYVYLLLRRKYKVRSKDGAAYVRKLWKYSESLDKVDKCTFGDIIRGEP